jgi:hypothetical protein
MTQKISPFIEGKYGWEYGESGWNSGMDENLLKFSFLFDGNIDSIVSSLPTASNGKAVFLTTDNRLYFAVGTTWYSSPVPKWFQLTDRATGAIFQFNGTSLVEVETSAELDTRVDAIELTVSTLGSAAFEESSYFATHSALEVASAQANTYTDEVVNKKGIVSVLDYIDNTVDGVTSNQSGIVSAVAAAYAAGAELLWPAGTYVSDANIPNFHDVIHTGDGVIKRGSDTFKLAQRGTQQNVIYVSVGGDDANDGLSASQPIKTLQRMMDVMQGVSILPRLTSGKWRVDIGAGTYTEGGSWSAQAIAKNYVEFVGKTDVNGVPTTIIDGTSASKAAGLYFAEGPSRVYVENIMSNNFRSNSVASGIVFANKGIQKAWVKNIYAENNIWAGINVDNIGQILTTGCVLDGNTQYNFRVRGGVALSIGIGGADPGGRMTLKNCATAVQIRDSCAGHFDYVDIIDCATGLWLTNVSRAVLNTCTLTNVNVGVRAGGGATFAHVDSTFTNVPTRFYTEQNASHDSISSGNLEGGDGLGYDSFHNRYAIGLRSWGGTLSGAPAYVFATDKTGTATYSYLAPDNTDVQMLVGNVSNSALFRTIYNVAGAQFRFQHNGVAALYASTTSVTSGRDNLSSLGTAVARWSTVYAGTGTINTSDERSKQQIKPVDDAALRAWSRVEYVQYKFNDAVEEKGDGARWHFGLIAQRVKEAFEAEGLDAFDYGLLCYDEWGETPAVEEQRDDDGNIVVEAEPYRPAGNRYGIRYEEALALECAYLRSKIDRL